MIWLTWRQFRAAGAMMAAALAALAVILAVTGPGLADDYSTGITACTSRGGDCSDFVEQFFRDHRSAGLAATSVVLVLPALIGIFWGAPLIARELDAGTHRLVWNQSLTRTRWLAVKLGLVGVAAVAVAGFGSLAVDWWSSPIEKAAGAADNVSRIEPLLFSARGIAPMGYAAFAFALGVTLGMLIRRTIPAMALTPVIFVGLQVAMHELVRPHLTTPTRATVAITPSNVDQFIFQGPNGPLKVGAQAAEKGAWVLSSHTVDASGRAVDTITGQRSLSPTSGPCAPPEEEPTQQAEGPGEDLAPCLAELTRLGYRQQVTYQPASHSWPLQWRETAVFTALALALSGFCFWWLRRVSRGDPAVSDTGASASRQVVCGSGGDGDDPGAEHSAATGVDHGLRRVHCDVLRGARSVEHHAFVSDDERAV